MTKVLLRYASCCYLIDPTLIIALKYILHLQHMHTHKYYIAFVHMGGRSHEHSGTWRGFSGTRGGLGLCLTMVGICSWCLLLFAEPIRGGTEAILDGFGCVRGGVPAFLTGIATGFTCMLTFSETIVFFATGGFPIKLVSWANFVSFSTTGFSVTASLVDLGLTGGGWCRWWFAELEGFLSEGIFGLTGGTGG